MKSLKSLIFLLVPVALIGCISSGTKIDYSNVNRIQKNVTTESQIREMFGEPVTTTLHQKGGYKLLTYGYKNDDGIQKAAATGVGATAGGLVGSQIGGGTTRYFTATIGALAGGILANNAVTSRREEQYLEVKIGLKSGKVIDYDYIEQKGRSQKLGVTSGVNPL